MNIFNPLLRPPLFTPGYVGLAQAQQQAATQALLMQNQQSFMAYLAGKFEVHLSIGLVHKIFVKLKLPPFNKFKRKKILNPLKRNPNFWTNQIPLIQGYYRHDQMLRRMGRLADEPVELRLFERKLKLQRVRQDQQVVLKVICP